jgi:hypothetical protein
MTAEQPGAATVRVVNMTRATGIGTGRYARRPLRERVLSRLIIQPDDCVVWSGAKTPRGYGKAALNGQQFYVHRLMYEWFAGPVPPELELDHLCRNPACANVAHLEAVPHDENIRRGTVPRKAGAR